MSKSAIDAPRGNTFLMDPEALTIVSDPAHPLYDERIHLPLDERMIRSIMKHGVRQAVNVRKNEEAIEVVDGRQRVRHAIEANRRLIKEGAEPVRIKVMLERGTDADMAGLGVVLNVHRRDDDLMTKAKKAQRLLDLGKTDEEVEIDFGITRQTLRGWQNLLEASPVVQKAVAAGDVSASAAAVIAKLPRADQAAKLAELKAGAPIKGKRAGKVSTSQARGKVKPSRPSARDIELVLKWVHPEKAKLLQWVLGHIDANQAFAVGLDEIREQVTKAEKKSEAKA
jgi:ParB family chromosome partitioning protein